MLRILLSFSISLLLTQTLLAESNSIDFLRSTGKIYSVVGVITIIFIGLAIYLWRIDRKLTKIENHIKDE
jgi:CcmD family protein